MISGRYDPRVSWSVHRTGGPRPSSRLPIRMRQADAVAVAARLGDGKCPFALPLLPRRRQVQPLNSSRCIFGLRLLSGIYGLPRLPPLVGRDEPSSVGRARFIGANPVPFACIDRRSVVGSAGESATPRSSAASPCGILPVCSRSATFSALARHVRITAAASADVVRTGIHRRRGSGPGWRTTQGTACNGCRIRSGHTGSSSGHRARRLIIGSPFTPGGPPSIDRRSAAAVSARPDAGLQGSGSLRAYREPAGRLLNSVEAGGMGPRTGSVPASPFSTPLCRMGITSTLTWPC